MCISHKYIFLLRAGVAKKAAAASTGGKHWLGRVGAEVFRAVRFLADWIQIAIVQGCVNCWFLIRGRRITRIVRRFRFHVAVDVFFTGVEISDRCDVWS